MNKYRLNINGKEVTGFAGQTILEVARENDIFIPTLCYDERTKIYGSCGLCMCEVDGNPTQEVLEKKEFLQRRMREKNYGKNLVCRQKNGKVSEKLCRTVVQ